MGTYLQRITTLKSAVRSFFSHKLDSPNLSYSTLQLELVSLGNGSNDLGGDLEIVFRGILNDFIHESSPAGDLESSNSVNFIKLATDFAVEYPDLTSAFSKIPFLMLEDLLEYQSVKNSKNLWKIVESLSEKLTLPSMFAKGKFTVLKICNSLLKKLSRSCDTEFCGRILMFLAAVYPISERSAHNLIGKINVGNITYFDEENTFAKNVEVLPSTETNKEVDNKVKSGGEDGEEIEIAKPSHVTITYEIYQAFWKLQSIFASDFKTFDNTGQQVWTDFSSLVNKVFQTLEANLSIDHDSNNAHTTVSSTTTASSSTTTANASMEITEENMMNEGDYMGSKYLTSSQLFLLQLKDPLIRQQVALQILILVHFLRFKALPLVKDDQVKANYEREFFVLHEKARMLLEKSAFGNGKDLVNVIQRILVREDRWLQWKSLNCPPFEKLPPQTPESQPLSAALESFPSTISPMKRKFSALEGPTEISPLKKSETSTSTLSSTVISEHSKFAALYRQNPFVRKSVVDSTDSIHEIAQKLKSYCTNLENQVDMFVEADDPDNGIEEEYHPKNDHVYCWRTRRLLAEKDLSLLQLMQDGNLGKGIRKYRNLPDPVPKPVNNDDEEEEEEKEKFLDEADGVSEGVPVASPVALTPVVEEEGKMILEEMKVEEVTEGESEKLVKEELLPTTTAATTETIETMEVKEKEPLTTEVVQPEEVEEKSDKAIENYDVSETKEEEPVVQSPSEEVAIEKEKEVIEEKLREQQPAMLENAAITATESDENDNSDAMMIGEVVEETSPEVAGEPIVSATDITQNNIDNSANERIVEKSELNQEEVVENTECEAVQPSSDEPTSTIPPTNDSTNE